MEKNTMNDFITTYIQGIEFKYNGEKDYEKDGHIYCKTCHKQVDGKPLDLFGKTVMIRMNCKCDEQRIAKAKEQEHRNKVLEIKRRCFIEQSQENYTFENADESTDQELLKKVKRYVEKFQSIRERNLGLLIYGGVGTGKTYISCSIANAIIEKYLYECKVINFSQILNDLQKGGFSLDRNEYISDLTSKTLLVLDDFGIERNTEYALEQIYNVINARYQKQKPTIITTNIDYQDMTKEQTDLMMARIYSRIIEMSVPLKIVGEDRRKQKQKQKIQEALKELSSD